MSPHLSNGRLNLSLLRDEARLELLKFLDTFKGSKAILWDPELVGPFGLISEYVQLKEAEVTQMLMLEKKRVLTDAINVVFLTKPNLDNMNIIANQINKDLENRISKVYHILFVPRKTIFCQKVLAMKDVWGQLTTVGDINLELYPFDNDVLSMELNKSFRECYVEKDETSLFHVARALMKIQSLYGVIPNVYGKGDCAKRVFEIMTRMRRELAGNEPHLTPQIHNLILVDRNLDLLTPMVTQLTYEGLLDEMYGINNNVIKVPPEKFSKAEPATLQNIATEPKTFILNSGEELYQELRDKNFAAIGSILSSKAKQLSAQYDERHGAKTVGQIKQFVDKLPKMQDAKKSLSNQTGIAELIKEKTDTENFHMYLHIEQDFIKGIDTDKVSNYIEDCIAQKEPLLKVLRLICIQSITNSGLRQKVLDHYKREILQTYGYEHMMSLQNLEMTELLKPTRRNFSTFRSTLRLSTDQPNEKNPTDIWYVHSGYAPMLIRLIQFLHQPGWRAIPDILNILPGPTIEENQVIQGQKTRRHSGSSIHSSLEEQKLALVFFIGGCTFSEISALRFLSKQEDASVEYIVATTKLINGHTFLESIMENFDPVSKEE